MAKRPEPVDEMAQVAEALNASGGPVPSRDEVNALHPYIEENYTDAEGVVHACDPMDPFSHPYEAAGPWRSYTNPDGSVADGEYLDLRCPRCGDVTMASRPRGA